MKLAEALVIRADLQTRINELENRLQNNATVQEGEHPAEDPKALIAELGRTMAELERLITAINLTNAGVKADGTTMTGLLARRDCLKRHHSILRTMLDSASIPQHRTRANEIIIKSTVSVPELQKECDRMATELRKLELRIQELNWLSELAE